MSNQYSYGGGGGGGYGAPPPGQQSSGYGQQQQYGGATAGGYGAPPPQQGGYGAPPPGQQGGYGGGAQQSLYGAPPHQGYGRPQAFNASTGPPAGADPQLWQWFIAVDRDRSGHINPQELSQALVNGDWTPFDLDTVKMLISVFDNELSNALQSFGYRLSPKLLHIVLQKYINSDAASAGGGGGGVSGGMPSTGPARSAGGITFDRFVRACVVIKTLTESFQRHDTNRSGWVQINYDTFMEMCLSAP
ncbi:related to programmed cell death protein (calcium-binding protein) [Ustilago trichophora]|uniref:Related to programmed cell death protein (Calcium-binding protein) n=1 Tax=Ustilago trichophora TaxID=86804 RepID=A0A5C3EN34_9BASI|nr:related to programmed cell death protein (calcium-binding protein) [Ustilago trichophora]